MDSTQTQTQSDATPPDTDEDFTVLIAGGGVAGLEAILALREAGPPSLRIEVLAPAAEFTLAPLSIVEPFGGDEAPTVDLAAFCAEHGATFTQAGLAEIWPGQQRVLTDDGSELPYDALLLCIGARRQTVLPEALSFGGGGDSERLGELVRNAVAAGAGRLSFVVPDEISWPLPLYEIALQAAHQLRNTSVEVSFQTSEPTPLHPFGPDASKKVETIMKEAGIHLSCGESFASGSGAELQADWIVTIPRLEVPEIPGLPQATHGFVPIDARMRVDGADRVWAVGDVTWSPIKQGGIAAQQADVAAADILAEAGVEIEVPAYAPVLRAALMTADGPFYLRSGTDADGGQRAPLWWPPAKVAGRLLAPYLAERLDPTIAKDEMLDLQADEGRDVDHAEALELALQWADIDAAQGQYRRALHWMDIAGGLNLVIPAAYREKSRKWRQELR